ncbi:MAG: Ferric enterobactin receptor precursor [Syntrophorhabdaceae bacterium PtaU1.Bin034]|nr:MAG: Ferric enterobactin receptor precursor [Syntrophorhabdaceae bacterium PtaU1.Bin034]
MKGFIRSKRQVLSGFCIIVLLVSIASAVQAEESAKPSGDVFTLGEIEVSAKGEEVKNVTIEKVPDQEMRLFNRDTVGDALNLLPGVTRSQFGARNEGMVYVRGLDVRHVPIFLDGIPIYVPYDGYPDLNRFTTFDLSEIVLSKGFTSVLYGPNTMGGAINLVSKRPEKPFEGNTGVGWFTGNGFKGYTNFGTNQKKWYAQGGISYINSDYFVLSDDFKRTATENGGKRENSYYRDWKYNLKFGLTPAEGHEYALSYWYQHGAKGVPPYTGSDPTVVPRYWQWPYWDKEGIYFNSLTPIGDKSYAKTRLYYDKYQNSLMSYDDATYSTMKKGSSFDSDYDDHTYGGSVELGTSLIPRNLLKLAGHYKVDVHKEHNQPNPYQKFEDHHFSIGAEDTITITKRLYSIVGLSYDKLKTVEAQNYNATTKLFSDYQKSSTDAWNPQAGLFYSLTDTAKVNASVSRKTRFPTIKDKYSYRLGTAIPNEDLKPEEAWNYEIGYQDVFFKRLALKTAVFYRDIKDFILQATVPDPSNPGKTTLQNQNIGHVEQYGFEIELTAPITTNFEAGGNYTYLDNNNRTNPDKLTDVPEHKFFIYAKYSPIKKLSILGDLEYDSKRWSSTNGVQVAKGFTVVNAKAMYEITKGLQIEAGVQNLFDKNYEISEGFPMPGRTYFSNLTYRF